MKSHLSLYTLFILVAFPLSHVFAQDEGIKNSYIDIQEVISPEHKIKAWLVRDTSLPIVAFQFAFKGAGSRLESKDTQGISRLLSNMLDEGAGNMDSQTFQKELNNLSISLGFSSSRDAFSGSVKTLSRHKDRAFELLKLALHEPRFDEDALSRMKKANQSRIRSSMSDPDWIASRIMNDLAFEGHPYALNSGGTLSSLDTIQTSDLKRFMNENLTRDRLKISVTGDIDPEYLGIILDNVFGFLAASNNDSADTSFVIKNQGTLALFEKDIPQSVIQIMQPGIDRSDPQYHTFQVMNFILGSSGFGSRLTEEIREKRGLTYGVYTYPYDLLDVDILGLSTSTSNDKVSETLAVIREEWQKMMSYPVTQEELDNAKSYLIGSLPLSLTSTDKIAGLLLSLQLDDLPIDYLDQRTKAIKQITTEDVFKVSQSLLSPEKFVTVLVGKPEGIENPRIITELPNVK